MLLLEEEEEEAEEEEEEEAEEEIHDRNTMKASKNDRKVVRIEEKYPWPTSRGRLTR